MANRRTRQSLKVARVFALFACAALCTQRAIEGTLMPHESSLPARYGAHLLYFKRFPVLTMEQGLREKARQNYLSNRAAP